MNCGRIHEVPDRLIGRRGKCTRCGALQTIPDRRPAVTSSGPSDSGITSLSDDEIPALDEDQYPSESDYEVPAIAPTEPVPVQLDPDVLAAAIVTALNRSAPVPVSVPPLPLPREPWLYVALSQVGWGTLGLGWFLLGIGLVRWYRGEVLSSAQGAGPLSVLFAGLVLVLLAAIPLLGVEAARHLRAIRYRRP